MRSMRVSSGQMWASQWRGPARTPCLRSSKGLSTSYRLELNAQGLRKGSQVTTPNEVGLEIHPQIRENLGGKSPSGEPLERALKHLARKRQNLTSAWQESLESTSQLLLPLPGLLPQSSSSRSHGNWLGRPSGKREKKPAPLPCPHCGLPAGQVGRGGERVRFMVKGSDC